MDRLESMQAYVTVVTQGSFTAAAERLALSKALVSKYVSQLEAHLGVRLLNRSTRTLHVTEAGRAYFEHCQKIIEEIDDLEDSLREGRNEPAGRLVVAAPQTFGERFVSRAATEFMQRHPRVTLDVQFADRYVNVVEEGFDLAIRIGELEDSTLVSRPLGKICLTACASPGYLAARGTPMEPFDLRLHDCVRDRNFRRGSKWPFQRGEDEPFDVDIEGRLIVNGIIACYEATLAGAGIGLLASHLIAPDLESGRLVRVLGSYRSVELPISAVYPHRLYLTAKVKQFVDFLAERLTAYGLSG